MPGYHKFEWDDFRVKAKPTGIRKVIRFLPYLVGTSYSFKVTLDTVSGEQRKLKSHLSFTGPDRMGAEASKGELSRQTTPTAHIDEKVDFTPIISGDHVFHITLELGGARRVVKLLTFRAIAQETITILIVAAVFAFVSAVVGGFIIKLSS